MNPADAHVLVIEDNALNRELVAGVLEKLGCHVTSADSAEAGLQAAARLHPDLILLDMRLPGMSGGDAIGLIRGHAALRTTPVIAVTAQAMQGDASTMLQAGFDAYLSKPIDAVALRQLVREHLARRVR